MTIVLGAPLHCRAGMPEHGRRSTQGFRGQEYLVRLMPCGYRSHFARSSRFLYRRRSEISVRQLQNSEPLLDYAGFPRKQAAIRSRSPMIPLGYLQGNPALRRNISKHRAMRKMDRGPPAHNRCATWAASRLYRKDYQTSSYGIFTAFRSDIGVQRCSGPEQSAKVVAVF